ncbi:5-oxoprolinase subunit B family protein [Nocardioides limicola]|uniref:5-oxoprolinase subunit B family protein n=1 Tax=Nocardioides limicola TaxID=2803368 RepID=UPI0027DE29EC|nr:allophanate hydrolase subunit 1 [Nocardioides sp. DJM-14]
MNAITGIRPVGPHAVLVSVADADAAVALATWARDRLDAVDIVPAARSVLVDGIADVSLVTEQVATWPGPAQSTPGPLVELEVRYDGPDLADVAQLWGLAPDEAAQRHADLEHRVAFCGFAPGFGYLSGLPEEWAVPRLSSPRSRVPAGAVAVADQWTGVYPQASPGGWRIIGHTDAELWDPRRQPPALLAPGVRVRFRQVR